MDREQQLISERERAHRAKALWENEMLQEAFDEVERLLVAKWRDSPEADSGGRERIFHRVFALKAVKEALQRHIRTGTLSEKEIEQLAGQSKSRLRRVF